MYDIASRAKNTRLHFYRAHPVETGLAAIGQGTGLLEPMVTAVGTVILTGLLKPMVTAVVLSYSSHTLDGVNKVFYWEVSPTEK